MVSWKSWAWFIEPQSRIIIPGLLTRINPTALLIADIFISDFRCDYCGSFPLATTALGINNTIRFFGAQTGSIVLKLKLDI